MKIIAIRHGEIALNALGKTTGWLDEELSPNGKQQAAALAESLHANFDTIFCSPLKRAMSTAQIIATKHPFPIIPDPNLRERNFGSLNGRSWDEIAAETGKDLRHLDIDLMDYDYRPYGGESAAQVIARVKVFVRRAQEHGSDLVAVTHGGIIKILYSLLAHDAPQPITNCSVHTFYVEAIEAAAAATE
jgi:2,3-bisphosphoglycerate-dependent phosphoglycerate mutase